MLSKEELYQKYIIEGKSTQRIGKEVNRNGKTVYSWLNKYGIPIRTRKQAQTHINMIGIILGTFKIIGRVENKNKRKNQQIFWVAECQKCGFKKEIAGWKFRNQKAIICNKCGKHHNFTGFGDISGRYWWNLSRGAQSRGIKFNISIEEAWNLFIKQKGYCALSGLPITLKYNYKDPTAKTASLDRINSNENYTIDNIQWVHKNINKLKSKLSNEELIRLCTIIADYNRRN